MMNNELIERAENVNLKILNIDENGFVSYKTLKGRSGFSGKSSISSFEKLVRRRELEKEIRLLEVKRRSVYNSLPQSIQEFQEIESKIEEAKNELKKFVRK